MAFRLRPLVCKLIQRQTYSCLSTRHGLWLAFFGICVIIVSAFHFGEVVLEWSMVRYAGRFHLSRYYDNIGGRSFETRMCLPQPIDMVYTWVNGSDPVLIRNLNRIKKDLEAELNRTSAEAMNYKRKRGKLINSDLFKWKSPEKCPFPNCVPANRIAVSGLPQGVSMHQLRAINSYFNSADNVEYLDNDSNIAFVVFKEHAPILNLLKITCSFRKQILNISEVFYTSTIKAGHKKLDRVLLVHEVIVKNGTDVELKTVIESKLPKSVDSVFVFAEKNLAAIRMLSKGHASTLKTSKTNFLNGKPLRLFPATYVWKPVSLSIDNTNQDFSSNRFADNDELKYSLRSVEKFVPWVRKVFIVTNGQIPSWLDIHHPRIKLVTHEEIFVNKSHLPTFSSPAIESHIHRIPGLSKKFIYMNDDVFFGAPVWPDDFFTHSQGHKIYLSWAVPNCNEGCPATWINDKYCDKACNVSACDYDGGDCIGNNAKKGWHLQQSRETQRFINSRLSDYCSQGCALNWVGDRYCDGNCNHLECAFDAGDCGTQNFNLLFSHTFHKDLFQGKKHSFIKAPQGTLAMYLNFTNIFDSLVEGSFTDTPILRNAIISKKFKVMSLTFFKNITETSIDFQVLGYKGANQTDKAVAVFKINITTIQLPRESDNTLINQTSISKEEIPKFLYGDIKQNTSFFSDVTLSEYPQNIFNLTLPKELAERLRNIQVELKNDELTQLGFNRSLGLLYQEYLKSVSSLKVCSDNDNEKQS